MHRFAERLYQAIARGRHREPLQAVLAGAAALPVYLATLAPGIVWGDSPELVAAAYQLGVPHPSGYPLYMLLGHAAIRWIPWGNPAFRMNLLSAFFAAAAVGVMHRLAGRLTGSMVGAWAAALALAFAPLFWMHALIAEVYALAVLLALLLLLAVVTWDQTGRAAPLRWAAFLAGVNLVHHLSIGLLAPGLIGYALTSRHRAQFLRLLPSLIGIGVLPLPLYLYLPLRARADPWVNWGDARTLSAAWAHLSGRFYRPSMFATPPASVWGRIGELPRLWARQLGGPGFLLALLGAGSLLFLGGEEAALRARRTRRDGAGEGGATELAWARLGWLLLPWALLSFAWGIAYWVYDYTVFYLPALVASCLLVGLAAALAVRAAALGGEELGRRGEPPACRGALPAAPAALLLLLLAWRGVGNWRALDRSGDGSALRYGRALAQSLPAHALVFGIGDDFWFPLFYVHGVEGARPDLRIFNLWDTRLPRHERLIRRYAGPELVVPRVRRGEGPNETEPTYSFLEALIAANVSRRPVVMLMDARRLQAPDLWPVVSRYYRVGRTNLSFWELYPLPPETRPAVKAEREAGTPFADGTRLLSFRAVPEQEAGVAWLRFDSRWLVEALDRGERLTARFRLAPEGGGRPVDAALPLGYGGLPPIPVGQPRTWGGSYWLMLGPEQTGRRYRLSVSLDRGGTPVPAPGGGFWADGGSVTVPPLQVE